MSEDAPTTSAVDLGGGDDLEFAVAEVNGRVAVRFNKLIQWFDMEPALAIAFAEKLIDKAQGAVVARPPNRALRRASASDLRKLT